MKLDLAELIQRLIYLGAYERWDTRTIRRHLRSGMCVVDVGANVGYYSLLASREVGATGRVIAIEPSSLASDRFATTIADNQITNVRLERCGLGQAPGNAILYDPAPDNHAPSMLGEPGTPGRVVVIRTLDELAASISLDQIDLLKIDVEGFEPQVFAGAQQLFAARRIRAVLCEFNEFWLRRGGTTGEAVYHNLLSHGFIDQTNTPYDPRVALNNNRFLVLPEKTPKIS